MNKAYSYNDFCSNGENATVCNSTFHNLSGTDNRKNIFMVKDIESDFQKIEIEKPKYNLSFTYPTAYTLTVNGKSLTYNVSNGSRVSTVVVEYGNSLTLTISPAASNGFACIMDYSNLAWMSVTGNMIVITNIKGDNQFTIRENSSSTIQCHLEIDGLYSTLTGFFVNGSTSSQLKLYNN